MVWAKALFFAMDSISPPCRTVLLWASHHPEGYSYCGHLSALKGTVIVGISPPCRAVLLWASHHPEGGCYCGHLSALKGVVTVGISPPFRAVLWASHHPEGRCIRIAEFVCSGSGLGWLRIDAAL